jgi:hypothetical protein
VILKELLRPNTLHDLDRFDNVFVPFFVNVSRACGLELLRHPAGSDSHIYPSARKVVPGRDLRRQDSGGPIRCVDYADTDPDLLGNARQIRNERQPLQPLASRSNRQGTRKLLHEAKRLAQLPAVGCLGYHDAVQSPDGIELDFLGHASEINDLADGYLVPEIW